MNLQESFDTPLDTDRPRARQQIGPDEIQNPMLRAVYGRVYDAGEPRAYLGWFERSPGKRPFFHETLILPLGGDGARRTICVYTFQHGNALL